MKSHECAATETKICKVCENVKPQTQFKEKGSKACINCQLERNRARGKIYYQDNKEVVLKRTKAYKIENADKVKVMIKTWYEANKDHVLSQSKERRSKPDVKVREQERSKLYYEQRKQEIQAKRKVSLMSDDTRITALKDYQTLYYLENKDKAMSKCAKRRSVKLNALAKWADMKLIRRFYTESRLKTKQTGVKHVVDHIIPLQGKFVSGLHVETNLQVITETENLAKFNKFIVG